MIPLWQGSCNQWDCDEMGHMNVRVYVEKQLEGMTALAHLAGMPNAFRLETPSTILPVDQHIRFVREVMPGKPISMRGCVLEIGDGNCAIRMAGWQHPSVRGSFISTPRKARPSPGAGACWKSWRQSAARHRRKPCLARLTRMRPACR
ncbi:MAG: thioesterase family protein [Hyphomonas sp.]|nr:thioesterase family protein [Hyphomonas sp.]